MEISTTHVVYSICLFDSVKEGICPLFHGHCLCFEHFEFVETVAFCLLAIIEPLALFTSITTVITLLRAVLRSGASSRSSWMNRNVFRRHTARPSACCPVVPVFLNGLVDCWVQVSAHGLYTCTELNRFCVRLVHRIRSCCKPRLSSRMGCRIETFWVTFDSLSSLTD
jgi:hypothetical protein